MNNKNNSAAEIEEMLSLAEDVWMNIQELQDSIVKINFGMMTSILGSYVSIGYVVYEAFFYTPRIPSLRSAWFVAGLMFFAGICILYFTNRLFYRSRMRRKLFAEKRVIKSLVQMLSSLIEDTSCEYSVVTRAIIDMRLKRIGFANKHEERKSGSSPLSLLG